MESIRQIGHRKILLPFEQELCEQLGLSKEEYFKFLEYATSQNGKRPKEYDNIPYVVNFQALGLITASGSLTALGQIVVGLVLTLVSYFLTPKPKPPKTPPSMTTAGQQGVRRFAPQTGFDTAQELAELGAVIPLVFAKHKTKNGLKYGGIRVNTQLLWSQMRSLGKGQQIKAIFALSSGILGSGASSNPNNNNYGGPDFNGFAIGDILLKNYSEGKFRLFWYDGSGDGNFRFPENKYPQGNLEREISRNGHTSSDGTELPIIDSDYTGSFVDNTFCATRTPSTQNIFGNYNPVPNSMRFMLPYELILIQKNLDGDVKDKTIKKRRKIQTNFPRYQAVVAKNGNTTTGNFNVVKNDRVTYQISNHDPNKEFKDKFSDWGTEDVASSVNGDRENTDDSLAIGEQYLVGTAKGILISHDDGIWEEGKTKQFTFKIFEPGEIQIKKVTSAHNPFQLLLIQKCAIGVITNSYKCDTTEIGLKSVVNKQITGFANVNSHPGFWRYYGKPDNAGVDGTVHDYEKKDGNISLGQLSKYVKRYSFFKLYTRTVGQDNWTEIGERPFAVLGRTPQPQYNFIRINHTNEDLREFKLEPFPGNKIKSDYIGRQINLLTGTRLAHIDGNNSGINSIYFNGESTYVLTASRASNPEWFLGEIPEADDANQGKVLSFDRFTVGTPRTVEKYVEFERKFNNDSKKKEYVGQQQVKAAFYPKKRTGLFFYVDNRSQGKYTDPKRPSGPFAENDTKYHVIKNGVRYHPGEAKYRRRSASRPLEFDNKYEIVKSRLKTVDTGMVSGYPKEVEPTFIGPARPTGVPNPSGLRLKVKLFDNGAKKWEIVNKGTKYREGDTVRIPFDSFGDEDVFCSVNFGVFVTEPWPAGQNLNPYDAIADYIKFDAERPSHLDQPEHQITYVNELVRANSNEQEFLPYSQLSNVGLKMNSSKEFNNFSQLSVYVKNGIKVENLITGAYDSSNLFPDIAYHLLTDSVNGAGNLIGATQINKEDMKKASQFCEANNFYWDGVITQQQNLREFIYQNALFCLLDFTIKGGQFSLTPAVPVNSNNEINYDVLGKDLVKALFTDGNTRNLKVSFLSPEERQLFQARVLYREEVENGFAKTEVLDLRFGEDFGGSQDDPREVFDMSNFCTSETHARTFAEYALLTRKFVDHGISFETTPESAISLQPGDHIRFFSEITHNDRFENGYISADGVIQSQGNSNPVGQNIFYWRAFHDDGADFGDPQRATLTVDNSGRAESKFRNSVFTIEKTDTADRIYKIEAITYTDEGFVQLSATHQPLNETGKLSILDYDSSIIFSDPN